MQLVAHARSAGEAVEAFRQHQPHVTLFDVRLEGSDGIEALARLPPGRIRVAG